MNRRTRTLAAVLSASLALTACGSEDPAPEAASPTPTPSATASPTPSPTPTPTETEEAGEPRPLNGLPFADAAALDRRVIAVKIDNHERARPQTGIDQADAVYELLVESGLTRFIAMFHSRDPEVVGPMRSGRPTDPTLILPTGGVFAISGAQDWVISRIRGAGVNLIGEVGRPATFRSSQRRAPHNLYVDIAALRAVADDRGYADAPPPEQFSFEPWDEDTGGVAGDVLLKWSNTVTVTWRFDDGVYRRHQEGEPHLLVEDGETSQIEADTLVVIDAPRYTARPPGRGTAVPAMDTVGSGNARVFHDGRVVEGSWARESASDPFTLTSFEGETLTVPPGRLWVSIFPSDRVVSW